MAWLGIDSSNYDSSCGNSGQTPQDALDGTDSWNHLTNETHYLILDLGSSQNVTRFKSRSNSIADPDAVNLYVSDSKVSWGTAVWTGTDEFASTDCYVIFKTTPKEGRYVKIEITSTENAINFLDYGDSSTPFQIFDVWTGEAPDSFVVDLDGSNGNVSNSTTSFYPTDAYIGGIIPFDGSKYSTIAYAYIELLALVTESCTPNQVPSITAQLYDYTASAVIGSPQTITATGGAYRYYRFPLSIADDLPAGAGNLGLQFKKSGCTSSIIVTHWKLVLHMESSTNTKARLMLPIGAASSVISTSYGAFPPSGIVPFEKHLPWDEDLFGDTIDAVYYGATIKATASETAYARTNDTSDADPLGEITTTSTTGEWKMSSDIKASITDGSTYGTQMKTSSAFTSASMQNGFIIVDVSDMTKYLNILSVNSGGYGNILTTYAVSTTRQAYYELNAWDGVTKSVKHVATLEQTGATSAETQLYDDGVAWGSTELTTTSSSPTLKVSGALTEPAHGSYLAMGVKRTGGARASGNVSNNYVWQEVSDITSLTAVTSTPLRTLMGMGI